jgi:hypothetical protein
MQNGKEAMHASDLDPDRLAVGQAAVLVLLHVPEREARLFAQGVEETETTLLSRVGIAMHALALCDTEFLRLSAAALVCQYGLFIGAEAFVDFAIGLAKGVLIHAITAPS